MNEKIKNLIENKLKNYRGGLVSKESVFSYLKAMKDAELVEEYEFNSYKHQADEIENEKNGAESEERHIYFRPKFTYELVCELEDETRDPDEVKHLFEIKTLIDDALEKTGEEIEAVKKLDKYHELHPELKLGFDLIGHDRKSCWGWSGKEHWHILLNG